MFRALAIGYFVLVSAFVIGVIAMRYYYRTNTPPKVATLALSWPDPRRSTDWIDFGGHGVIGP